MDLRALPPDVRERATTLAVESGGPVDRTGFLCSLLGQLERWYASYLHSERSVIAAWRSLNVTAGRAVTVSGREGVFGGTALDIDDEGRLLVRDAEGAVRAIASGDVTITGNEAGERQGVADHVRHITRDPGV
jgi:BirA family biotin operon repressor/biotin-[acetyl-CoA-carboxylase] ligase